MVLDYLIVGGGLSGLYRAYQLSKTKSKAKIHIYQDSDRIGGRIYTHTLQNGTKVDMGAGRIATHHPLTMKLLKELKLEKDLVPLSNVPLSLEELKFFDSEEDALCYLTKLARSAIKKIPKKYLTGMSFMKVCRLFFSKKLKKIQEAIHVSGYDTEFEVGNGWIMCHAIIDMYKPDLKFASIKGGLSRIIDGLIEKLQKKKNVKIHPDHCVYGWNKQLDGKWRIQWKSKKEKDIHITLSHNLHISTGISSWEYWFRNQTIQDVPVNILDSIEHINKVSLCRIYTTYENTDWISVIKKCATKTPLRYIIPITKDTVMISYLDGEKADELSTLSDDDMKDWVVKGTALAFPGLSRFIPEPSEIKRGYWKVGVHLWKPAKHFVPPSGFKCSDDTFSFSGEAFSQFHQAWMEGALQLHSSCEEESK